MSKQTKSKGLSGDSLFGPPPVLEGEDAAAYDELLGRVYAAIKPFDVIDEMLIADVVSSECEFLRWNRVKLGLIQVCAAKALESFLEKNLDYNVYRNIFAEDLTDILQDKLPEDQANYAQTLARDCARNETEAVNKVNKILSSIGQNMDYLIDRAQAHKAEELVQEYLRREPRAVRLVVKLLAKAGVTMDALIVEGLEGQLGYIERVDRLATIAEGRRDACLREIDRRRSVPREKLRRSLQEIEEGEVNLVETTATTGKARLD